MSASSKKKLRKEQTAAMLTEKQQKEQAEAKKLKAISVTFVVVMLVIALTAASILVIRAVNNSGVIDRNTIAAITGKHELNSVQMNYYFTDQVQNAYQGWKEAYGNSLSLYTSMMGLNLNKALDKQVIDEETGETWAENFLKSALEKAKSDYALYDMAVKDNFKLSEDEQDTMEYNISMLDFYALYSGYTDANSYLKAHYGYGSDVESYTEYVKISTIANAYYKNHKDSLTYDSTAIREHEEKNPLNYTSYSYASYYVVSSNYITGGTKNENGTIVYTDAEKEAGIKAAEEVANKLAENKNVVDLDKAIAALDINKGKEDAASTKNSLVLYTDIPSVLQRWLSEEGRVENDITVIANEVTSKDADGKETKTIAGYYVVLFQARDENLRALANVRHLLVKFQGGKTTSSGTTYTDEEKAKAKAEAERLLKVWQDGAATEETFIAMIKEYSDDGSAEDGGLFEDIHRNSDYVDSFKNWSLDIDRKPGDTGVIVSDYGYHIMYYVSDDALTYRDYMIQEELREADVEKWYDGIVDAAKITTVKTNRLNLDMILGG